MNSKKSISSKDNLKWKINNDKPRIKKKNNNNNSFWHAYQAKLVYIYARLT
jgi:hypothetical protein